MESGSADSVLDGREQHIFLTTCNALIAEMLQERFTQAVDNASLQLEPITQYCQMRPPVGRFRKEIQRKYTILLNEVYEIN